MFTSQGQGLILVLSFVAVPPVSRASPVPATLRQASSPVDHPSGSRISKASERATPAVAKRLRIDAAFAAKWRALV